MSLSVLVVCLIPVFILLCGLVVDGSAAAAGRRDVAIAAAQAARAGSDASAAFRLTGDGGAAQATAAAHASLAEHCSDASASVSAEVLHTRCGKAVPTVFLSFIGVGSITVSADASAELVRPGR